MDTLLVKKYDYWKPTAKESNMNFPQFFKRLLLKFFIVYLGAMLLLFFFYFRTSTFHYTYPGNFVRGCPGMVGLRCYPEYPASEYTWLGFIKFVFDYSVGNWSYSSVIAQGPSVSTIISPRLPVTLEILLYSSILIITSSLILGFFVAKVTINRRLRFIDRFLRLFIGIFLYVPLIGVVFQYSLGVKFDIFPVLGLKTWGFGDPASITGLRLIDCFLTGEFTLFWDTLYHLFLPILTLTLCGIGLSLRFFRNSFIRMINRNYIRMNIHKERNSSMKSILHRKMKTMLILSSFKIIFPTLIFLTFILEHIFHLRGVGELFIDAVKFRDNRVIIGVIFNLILVNLSVNFGISLLQYILNQRER